MTSYEHKVKNIYLWPEDYQEVEYIESTGTQYILLSGEFKTSYKTTCVFQLTQTWGDQMILWARFSNYNTRYWIDCWRWYITTIAWNSATSSSHEWWTTTIPEDINKHTVTVDKTNVTVDGVWYTQTHNNNTTNQLGVFAYNNNDTIESKANTKIYSCEIRDENNVKIYDLIPCYRTIDNEIGMYDTVNDVFYTNSGTWTFIKWPNV